MFVKANPFEPLSYNFFLKLPLIVNKKSEEKTAVFLSADLCRYNQYSLFTPVLHKFC